MIAIRVKVLQFKVMCFAASSTLQNQCGAKLNAVKWDVLHLITKILSSSWIMVRSVNGIMWGVIYVDFHINM